MILFHPLHYKSRLRGDALNIIFMVLYYPIPDLKERDPSITILNIASFSGSFITPPQRGRGETPDCPSLIQLLGGPGLPLPSAAAFLGLPLPHPRGEEERPLIQPHC